MTNIKNIVTRLAAASVLATMPLLATSQIIYIDDSGRGNDPYASAGHFSYVGEAAHKLDAMAPTSLRLRPGLFSERFELNRAYMWLLSQPSCSKISMPRRVSIRSS